MRMELGFMVAWALVVASSGVLMCAAAANGDYIKAIFEALWVFCGIWQSERIADRLLRTGGGRDT